MLSTAITPAQRAPIRASRAEPRRPDFIAAAECALAFARPLATGWITFGEVEARLMPLLVDADWQDVDRARDLAHGFITKAIDTWQVTR